MKIAMITMEVKSGQCNENFMFMKRMIEKAKVDKADMVIFPQNAISGYYLGDQWKDASWCQYVDSFNDRLIELSDDIAIVWGNIKYRGRKLFNAAFFAYRKETSMRVKKRAHSVFAQDDVFDELDINSAIDFQDEVFALNFQKEIQVADWNINVDASPFDVHRVHEYKGNVIYVNAVGMQNLGKAVVVMEGGSYVCKESVMYYQEPYGKEGYALLDLDHMKPVASKQMELSEILACGIRGFDQQVFGGKIPWIIGLSGGLDSSVSAALLTYALGSERILGYSMSSHYNSDKTKQNAVTLANALNIPIREGSILPLVDSTQDVLNTYGYENASGLAIENIQARLRGHLLSTFASLHGGVVVNNGNKVENALGYCTLYGDAIGALGIIGDLTKVQLFELVHELHEKLGKEVIPNNLIPVIDHGKVHWDVAPAAELKAGQVDPMKWYYHDYLVDHLGRDLTIDQLLKSYLNGSIFDSEVGDIMRQYGLDDPTNFIEDLDWFLSTAQRNAFKHLQVPSIITISKNGYAFAKEVQAHFDQEYLQILRKQILDMKKV